MNELPYLKRRLNEPFILLSGEGERYSILFVWGSHINYTMLTCNNKILRLS